MSVVVCKINKENITVSADTIMVHGWSKTNGAANKFNKIMKYRDMIIGGVGTAEEISLLFHYMKTHDIEEVSEKAILDYMIEFRRWKKELTGDGSINNHYIMAYQGKAYAIEDMFVFPIDDYYAIGAGADYASGALMMGASAERAVAVACELCAMVCEPIISYEIEKK